MANVFNTGGSGANVQSKTVKSTTSQQILTPGAGIDGFNPVIVSPMSLGNITIDPASFVQTITPASGSDGWNKIIVNPAPYLAAYYSGATGNSTLTNKSLVFTDIGSWKELYFVYLCSANIPANGVTNEVYQIVENRYKPAAYPLEFLYASSYNMLELYRPSNPNSWMRVYLSSGTNLVVTIQAEDLVFRTASGNSYNVFLAGKPA